LNDFSDDREDLKKEGKFEYPAVEKKSYRKVGADGQKEKSVF